MSQFLPWRGEYLGTHQPPPQPSWGPTEQNQTVSHQAASVVPRRPRLLLLSSALHFTPIVCKTHSSLRAWNSWRNVPSESLSAPEIWSKGPALECGRESRWGPPENLQPKNCEKKKPTKNKPTIVQLEQVFKTLTR